MQKKRFTQLLPVMEKTKLDDGSSSTGMCYRTELFIFRLDYGSSSNMSPLVCTLSGTGMMMVD